MPVVAPVKNGAASVEEELLGLLARQGRRMPIPVFLVALLTAAMAYDKAPGWAVAAWLSCIIAVLLARWMVLGRLPSLSKLTLSRRLWIAAAMSTLNGMVHGSAFGFWPYLSDLERAVQSMIIFALCAGSVASTAGYLPVFLGFVFPAATPLGVMWVIGSGDAAMRWIEVSTGFLIAMMMALLTAMARDSFRLFKESFEIRLQQVELNRHLRRALDEAEAASRAKTRFLASASHDLRQPMHTLSLFGAALLMRPLDQRSQEIARHMNAALLSLGSQLDALLDISKLDAGVVSVKERAFSLSPFLQHLKREFEPIAARKGLALTVECPAGATCQSDEMLLGRILRNLIDNAIKYTERGEVSVSVTECGSGLELKIRDSGAGIPASEHVKVFEEFYQLDNPERDRARGLGLGLSIVKRLVDLLHLRLSMTSVPGRGTQFTVTLPVASMVPAERNTSPDLARSLEGLRILVIDDEEAVREGMLTLLESCGCKVSLATGTTAATALASADRPDIVLADFRLRADDDGIKAVVSLRALYPRLPALLISGDIAPDRLREAHEAGLRLLHKPVPVSVLTSAIKEEIDQRGGAAR
jgi:signal transduction histidine kinase/CheY-like chemotaxis protein